MPETKKKKCSCGHVADYHYISDLKVSLGKVFCGKDNCSGWRNCNLEASLIEKVKTSRH